MAWWFVPLMAVIGVVVIALFGEADVIAAAYRARKRRKLREKRAEIHR
jgi:hypothetical protein